MLILLILWGSVVAVVHRRRLSGSGGCALSACESWLSRLGGGSGGEPVDGQTSGIYTPSASDLGRGSKIVGAHINVVLSGMMFCVVVCIVFAAFAPIDEELIVGDTVADPVEAHVDGFGSALLDGVVGESNCNFIVGLDGSCRLGMAHFDECGS